jgi:hypothetical protein
MPRSSPLWTFFNDFHIEKARLPVVVVTDRGERLAGDIFVAASPLGPNGHEEAHDLLDASELFFPLATRDGRTLLCAKAHVREVIVARDAVQEPNWDLGTTADVAIQVVGGESYCGAVLIEQAAAHKRVLDFLNRLPSRFMQVFTAEGVVHINRDCIVRVEHLV